MNGQVTKKWLYAGGNKPVAELDAAGNVKKRYGPGYIVKNDTTYRVIKDHLGSVRMVVNSQTGETVQRIDYDAWGNITQLENPDEFTDIGFAGGLYDKDTKLVRFGARDYDPQTGRWTSKDPILFQGGTSNLYEYVVNDPVNGVDPKGLQVITLQFTVRGQLMFTGSNTIGVAYDGKNLGVFNTFAQGMGIGIGATGGVETQVQAGLSNIHELEGIGFSLGGYLVEGAGADAELNATSEILESGSLSKLKSLGFTVSPGTMFGGGGGGYWETGYTKMLLSVSNNEILTSLKRIKRALLKAGLSKKQTAKLLGILDNIGNECY